MTRDYFMYSNLIETQKYYPLTVSCFSFSKVNVKPVWD